MKNLTKKHERRRQLRRRASAAQGRPALCRPPLRQRRRGILLLVALSMLVLFLLVGTAFIVTARQSALTAKKLDQAARAHSTTAANAQLLDDVLMQVVRDTSNQQSTLRTHSLLRDLYGEDGFTAGIVPPPAGYTASTAPADFTVRWASANRGNSVMVTRAQMIEIDLVQVETLEKRPLAINQLSPIDNAYAGQQVTFVGGEMDGRTVRIIGSRPDRNSGTNPPRWLTLTLLAEDLPASPSGQPFLSPFELQQVFNEARVLVNGRPFNGTGVGYDPTVAASQARLSASGGGGPLALLPNSQFFFPGAVSVDSPAYGGAPGAEYFITPAELATLTDDTQRNRRVREIGQYGPHGLGGSDESYDAPDFQNMMLGLMPQTPVASVASGSPSLGSMVLPSLHRPALLNYWSADYNALANEQKPALLRKMLLRPSWWDHPEFTGSNSAFAAQADDADRLSQMIYGPWDVDNDNDSVPDSVWTDFGGSVMSMPDGTLVKPMAAILCIDLDGRLNVNLHDSQQMAAPPVTAKNVADGASTTDLPEGSGYGSAEISLDAVLGNRVDEVLFGDATLGPRPIPGRYGPDQLPGKPNEFDMMSQLQLQGTPHQYGDRVVSAFGTPPNLNGIFSLGVNQVGQPVFEATGITTGSMIADSPYEMNLASTQVTGESVNGADAPFMLTELERLLRPYDADSGALPNRLALLGAFFASGSEGVNFQNRNLITTSSVDVSNPGHLLPAWVVKGPSAGNDYSTVMGRHPTGATFSDLLEYRLRLGGVTNANNLTQAIRRLLPSDFALGNRLDINRPLGNGRDGDYGLEKSYDGSQSYPTRARGVGTVDEPGEVEDAVWSLFSGGRVLNNQDVSLRQPTGAFINSTSTEVGSGLRFDLDDRNGDGLYDPADPFEVRDLRRTGEDSSDLTHRVYWDNFRRQQLARDLYITAMAVADPLPTAATADTRRQRAQTLAQWAINVVDFRDADSAMTPFEYDINPFADADSDGDPWDVDNNVASDSGDHPASRGVVWGMERPELLMTETLAWHDRRTTDGASEIPYPPRAGTAGTDFGQGQDDDKDYDQQFKPQGALLVELYNPTSQLPGVSAETRDVSTGYDLGVDLTARAPNPSDVTSPRSPVWRIAVYKRREIAAEKAMQWDTDHPDPSLRPEADGAQIDRSIYFTNYDPAYDHDGQAFYSSSGAADPVRPGRYLVVGSGDERGNSGVFEATVAPSKASRNPGQPDRSRYIELNTNPATHKVRVCDADDQSIIDPTDKAPLPSISPGLKMEAPADSLLAGLGADLRGDISDCIADVAIINQPRRLSVSEPAGGYPVEFGDSRLVDGEYVRVNNPTSPAALDVPLDGPIGGQVADLPPDTDPPSYLDDPDPALYTVDEYFSNGGDDPRVSYAILFLQRLANPLLPWNPDASDTVNHNPDLPVNPYLTVDKMPTNLTVFNSMEANEEDGTSANEPSEHFASVQRGFTERPEQQVAGPMPSLWRHEALSDTERFVPNGGSLLGQATEVDVIFQNISLKAKFDFHFNAVPQCTMGYLNRPLCDPNEDAVRERHVEPEQPFQWLTWNDRPYVSGDEVMQVPATRSSQLGATVTPAENNAGQLVAMWPYKAQPATQQGNQSNGFNHLLNFFTGQQNPAPPAELPTSLYGVLEYLQVPSRFVGTQQWLSPNTVRALDMNKPMPVDDIRFQFSIPFNKINTGRELGKVNLNTMSALPVYEGLMHGVTNPQGAAGIHPGPEWDRFVESRRGYSATGTQMLELDPNTPTFFANPFRDANAADLVPVGLPVSPVQATMLRSGANDLSEEPLFASQVADPAANASRNSYFNYQPMTRLKNLTTTRSNVYAIWITVGFFEVEPAPTLELFADLNEIDPDDDSTVALYERVYPEGYQLSREYGIDTGDDQRMRSFNVVDRTLPVGFLPGVDGNARKVIRLERQIE